MNVPFEGGEGTGKTTLMAKISEALKNNHKVITTREPGGSMISEAIRDVILNPSRGVIHQPLKRYY